MANILQWLDALKVRFNRMQEGTEGYEKFYGAIDYSGKTVIDIGAEMGTTADFFISKGARLVYCYEVNPILKDMLETVAKLEPKIIVMDRWDGEDLPDADILKMDCEGCEYHLSEDQLTKFEQWAIAIHRPRYTMPKVLAMQNMLLRNGARLVADLGFEQVYIKSIRGMEN